MISLLIICGSCFNFIHHARLLRHAIKLNPFAIKYGSSAARANRELAHLAVGLDWRALAYVSEALRSTDRTLADLAISQSGWALKFLTDPVRSDRALALKAVGHKPWALQYLRGSSTILWPSDLLNSVRAMGHFTHMSFLYSFSIVND